jgi:hypothetical protein
MLQTLQEVNNVSVNEEIPLIVWNMKVLFCVHRSR